LRERWRKRLIGKASAGDIFEDKDFQARQ
jgi:hypothetical protein